MSNQIKPKLAILIAFYNRKNFTVEAVEKFESIFEKDWQTNYFFCDDGSADGTKQALLELNLRSTFVTGNGSWFWAKSMAMAEKTVPPDVDAIVWLNDDVFLDSMVPTSSFLIENLSEDIVWVGALTAKDDRNSISYGPVLLKKSHPLRIKKYSVSQLEHLNFDTFNGNFVFVPYLIAKQIGPIDSNFSHAFSDFDYGLRVRKAGFLIKGIPFVVGVCSRNPPNVLTFNQMLKHFNHPKIFPFSDNIRFLRKHGGKMWLFFLSQYLLSLMISAMRLK